MGLGLEPEKHALNDRRPFCQFINRQIGTPYPENFFSVFSCMFFRPEEDGLLSKRIDDAFVLEGQKIHVGNENQRIETTFDRVLEVAVDRELHRLLAVCAFGPERDHKLFVSQAPLREGRGKRVHRSGGVYFLAAAEREMMWCRFHRYRIRPGDFALPIPEKEGHVLLEVGKKPYDAFPGQAEAL